MPVKQTPWQLGGSVNWIASCWPMLESHGPVRQGLLAAE
jgi:hypothetical protein